MTDERGRRVFLSVLVLLATTGCRKRWIDTRATELHVNGLAAPIPEGWRDVHELVVQPTVSLPPGSRILVIERPDAVGEIDVVPLALVAVGNNPCESIGAIGNAMGGSNATLEGAEAATFDGDPGCLMQVSLQGLHGKIAIRSHAQHAVMVRCLSGLGARNGEVDYACEKVLYGLRLVSP